ncbi:MAG: divalent-cation tolerance protein CutA [Desulfobulbaceae bacterium]
MTHYIQVVTTTDSKEAAEAIAAAVLAERLAACVQINQCQSWYRWQGKVEQAAEFRCTLKSRADLYPQLEEMIRRLHPYEVPEILAFAVSDGTASYLAWLDQELRSGKESMV